MLILLPRAAGRASHLPLDFSKLTLADLATALGAREARGVVAAFADHDVCERSMNEEGRKEGKKKKKPNTIINVIAHTLVTSSAVALDALGVVELRVVPGAVHATVLAKVILLQFRAAPITLEVMSLQSKARSAKKLLSCI